MYCSNCGKEISSNVKFCYNCGKSLNNEVIEKRNEKNKNEETSLVLGIICLVSSFFLSILCFIPGIISIIYAKKYKRESGKLGVGFGLSLAGMIYSFITLVISILFFALIINVTNTIDHQDTYNDYNYTYTENVTEL